MGNSPEGNPAGGNLFGGNLPRGNFLGLYFQGGEVLYRGQYFGEKLSRRKFTGG